MQKQIASGKDVEYWHQVELALLQLKGLEDSYQGHIAFPSKNFAIMTFGFLFFQLSGDLEDLEPALIKTEQSWDMGSGFCSALIKLLPNSSELLVSQDTWNSYQHMFKKCDFLFWTLPKGGSPLIPKNKRSFSSYLGIIFSCDDFHILSSGLVILETSSGDSIAELWKHVKPQNSVLQWLPNIMVNRLAQDGTTWSTIFKKFNSGTYNNQWMIIGYNASISGKYKPINGSPSPSDGHTQSARGVCGD